MCGNNVLYNLNFVSFFLSVLLLYDSFTKLYCYDISIFLVAVHKSLKKYFSSYQVYLSSLFSMYFLALADISNIWCFLNHASLYSLVVLNQSQQLIVLKTNEGDRAKLYVRQITGLTMVSDNIFQVTFHAAEH